MHSIGYRSHIIYHSGGMYHQKKEVRAKRRLGLTNNPQYKTIIHRQMNFYNTMYSNKKLETEQI